MLGHLEYVNVLLMQRTVSWTNLCVLSVQWMAGWTMWMYCSNAVHGH